MTTVAGKARTRTKPHQDDLPVFDASTRQWRLLTILATNPDLPYTAIAEREGLSASHVRTIFTRMSDKLTTGRGGAVVLIAFFWHCHYHRRMLSLNEFWDLQSQVETKLVGRRGA